MKLIIIIGFLLLNFSNIYSTGYSNINWVTYKPQKKSANQKTRLVWNEELQNLYNQAKNSLDKEKQTPAKILEKMNILNKDLAKNLTREHISSHLQKDKNKNQKAREILEKMKIDNLLN
jgi:SHAQKYF class myb-like DNA-binding protein